MDVDRHCRLKSSSLYFRGRFQPDAPQNRGTAPSNPALTLSIFSTLCTMFAMCCSQYGQAEERNDVYYSSIVGQPSDGTKEQGAPQSLMPYPNGAYWNAGGDDLYHLASGLTSSFEPLPTDVELFTSQAGLQYSESDDGYARRTNDETLVGELPLDMIEPSVDLPGDQAVHMTQTELLLMMGCPETILQVGNSALQPPHLRIQALITYPLTLHPAALSCLRRLRYLISAQLGIRCRQ
ncbi:hypothetical protein OBBRIDRAFT_445659 [Obba rivulosa]|uniref:Uncharacterized protein n=1 Tax=Obba rivulosa TaxID=1052685 RepID=A0A8E2J811_9APHY|nr:hypothetical protein OBBRIDRAFT_445659 [Obba rivulosa]